MNIVLTGMPSSGKTETAKTLKKLLKDFVLIDTDEKIIQKEKMSVNEIFALKGEEYFRQIETAVLKEVLENDKQIISSGGGIVKKDENVKLLKEKAVIVYLKADINTLYERARKSSERPLLNGGNLREKLETLYKDRKEKYEQAHIIINTDRITPEKTAEEIMEKINEYYKR